MIESERGCIDYDECGEGPTVVLVPGSCSTGAAWRPIMSQWRGGFRCVTTSLLGYGGTAERRTAQDADIRHEIEILEAVIRRAACPVHLVGHSFGGLVSLAVALRNQVPLLSLTIIEAPAPELLRHMGEHQHYRAFREMTEVYFKAFHAGDTTAIEAMIDFYGGAGVFASWPEKVRCYAVKTTAVNILDWASAYNFPLTPGALAKIGVPDPRAVGRRQSSGDETRQRAAGPVRQRIDHHHRRRRPFHDRHPRQGAGAGDRPSRDAGGRHREQIGGRGAMMTREQ